MLSAGIIFTLVLAGAAQVAPAVSRSDADACQLLTFDEVRQVQAVVVQETKTSERRAKGEHHSNCVFVAQDFAHSVSVTLTTIQESAALAEYWKRTFDRDGSSVTAVQKPAATRPKGAERPLHRVPGLGAGAVWTSDSKAGSLYVLGPGAVLRISVGGVSDVSERLRRSQALATMALRRLEGAR
jgi:hypothetical protein